MARPEISGRKLVSYDDLEPRGIRFSRVHLRRLEARGLFPQHVTIGAGNFIAWFEDEVDQYLDRLAAARPKRAAPKTTTDNAEVTA
jgi:predicted DNA-binding transcriptional regulator AlpA